MIAYSQVFLLLAALLYFISAFYSVLFVTRGEVGRLPRYTRRFLVGGLIAQIIYGVLQARLLQSMIPMSQLADVLSFFAIAIVLIYFLIGIKREIRTFTIVLSPFLFLLVLLAAIAYTAPTKVLDMPLTAAFIVHIISIFLSYGAFFVSFISAAFYLLQSRGLKHKTPSPYWVKFPGLESLRAIFNETILVGFVLMTLSILSAYFLIAASSDGVGDWHSASKLLVSLLVWGIYLLILLGRAFGFFKGKNSAWVSVGAFSLVMLAFLGIRFYGYFVG
jgi:ABC-type uncharacterized transport system permease subunit